MSSLLTLEQAIPIDLVGEPIESPASQSPLSHLSPHSNSYCDSELEEKIKTYVLSWKAKLYQARILKQNIWDECWQLYRGQDDFSNKEEWQSKMVLPKAWSSVKQATNVIKRLLNTAKEPFQLEAENQDDLVTVTRAEKMTSLVKVFMESAHYLEEFATGLECGFIMGIGVWKQWWAMEPRQTISAQSNQSQHPVTGEVVTQRQIVQSTVNEGKLFMRAVDPYNFFWLPGSKLNRWVGTLELIQISKWELLDLAMKGVFGPNGVEKVKSIQPKQTANSSISRDLMRFGELSQGPQAANTDMGMVELIEFYGPIVIDDVIIERAAHVLIANDSIVLTCQKNSLISKQPPYNAFSPLSLPFRTEGMGLIEMVRAIDKALSKLANLSVDTLLFRLMPLFEVNLDVYENPEDFETGFTPGKIFRRNLTNAGVEGIKTIQMEDISSGTMQVSGQLDRSHQEGALVTELQQSLPRFSGAQTATETTAIQSNQDSFFGSMAVDIEIGAIQPIVQLATELLFQFIDTTTDPRVASLLGVDAAVLGGISKVELMEMVNPQGMKVKVTGITSQLMKAEALQQLVQFMNLIGQNPQHWLPYINQDALLRRILESFRPAIHDIENIIADPATAQAKQQAMALQDQHGSLLAMLPQLKQMAHDAEMAKKSHDLEQTKLLLAAQGQAHSQGLERDAQQHAQSMAETGQLIDTSAALDQRNQLELARQAAVQDTNPAPVG